MPRFTGDELRRLADEHQVPDRDIKVRDAWMRRAVRQAQTAKEREVIRRFAETPAYDDAAAQRALLPTYTDLPGLSRWPRAAHVWRSRSLAVRAPGSEAWVVALQDDPAATDVEDFRALGPYTSWAEAMDVARAEARYVVERPDLPAPATPPRTRDKDTPMTDHPLTEDAVTERWDAHPRLDYWKTWDPGFRADLVSTHRDAFNAGREYERANPADDRPWEPLAENDPLRVGDEVRQENAGITTIAVVGRVDGYGHPWAAGGSIIGFRRDGTWYVRPVAPELPPERDGIVLVPADGYETITAADEREFSRLTYSKTLSRWYGPCLAPWPESGTIRATLTGRLTPGTWKVADQ